MNRAIRTATWTHSTVGLGSIPYVYSIDMLPRYAIILSVDGNSATAKGSKTMAARMTKKARREIRMATHRIRKYKELRKACRRCRKGGSICAKHTSVRLGTMI